MNHYHCFTVYNSKTKQDVIASTFHWAESNRFSAPKITDEEQLTLADQLLQSNIDKICNIFHSVDNIVINKLRPIEEEENSNTSTT